MKKPQTIQQHLASSGRLMPILMQQQKTCKAITAIFKQSDIPYLHYLQPAYYMNGTLLLTTTWPELISKMREISPSMIEFLKKNPLLSDLISIKTLRHNSIGRSFSCHRDTAHSFFYDSLPKAVSRIQRPCLKRKFEQIMQRREDL